MNINDGVNKEYDVQILIEDNEITFEDTAFFTDQDDEFLIDSNHKNNEDFQDVVFVDDEIPNHLNADEEDYEFDKIKSYHWDQGMLILTILLRSGKKYDAPFSLIKKDRPVEVAQFIKGNVVEKRRGGRYEQWAKKVLNRA